MIDTGEPEQDIVLSTTRTAAKTRALLSGVSEAEKTTTIDRFMRIETLSHAKELHAEAQ